MTGGRTDVTLPQGQIAIYPNPARELFFVEMEGPFVIRLTGYATWREEWSGKGTPVLKDPGQLFQLRD